MPKKNESVPDTQPKLVDDFVRPVVEPPKKRPEIRLRLVRKVLKAYIRQKIASLHPYRKQLFTSLVILLVACALIFITSFTPPYDPVPASIRKSVKYNIYYPAPTKLPTGYVLNTHSFEASNQAILYTVSYGNGKKLVFTVQAKPSNTAIQTFYRNNMPLSIPISTSAGTAALGVINNETVISLPTNTNSWILTTAPLNANQSQLKEVIEAETLAR